jgi:hypothetical protein
MVGPHIKPLVELGPMSKIHCPTCGGSIKYFPVAVVRKIVVGIWLFFNGEIATLKDLAYISKLIENVGKKYKNFSCRFKHTKCTNSN